MPISKEKYVTLSGLNRTANRCQATSKEQQINVEKLPWRESRFVAHMEAAAQGLEHNRAESAVQKRGISMAGKHAK